jgi:tight adherence protein B
VIFPLVSIFLATLSIIVGGYIFVNRRSFEEADVARERLTAIYDVDRVWRLLKDDRISEVGFLNKLLSGRNWVEELGVQLQQAGSTLKPGAFIMIALTSAIFGVMLSLFVVSGFLKAVWLIVGLGGPFFWLRRAKRKRLRTFEAQIPDAIDMLVSAMKAGYSFQAATQFIGDEMKAPAGPEFARFYDEQRLGIDVRVALLNLQSRIDSLDLKMFVTAVLIQRETGGNLGDVLSNLADLIRERITMRGNIQSLIAEPKLSAKFLASMPVVVYIILALVSPGFTDPLVHSSGGKIALAAAATGVVIGYMIMMKIADVDI